MNTKALTNVISIMEQVKPEEFDMKYIYNANMSTKDVIAHVYKHLNPAIEFEVNSEGYLDYDKEGILGTFIIHYLGAIPWTEEEYYKMHYITSNIWCQDRHTNTIKHLIYRINMLIDGYKPGEVNSEYKRELEIIYG